MVILFIIAAIIIVRSETDFLRKKLQIGADQEEDRRPIFVVVLPDTLDLRDAEKRKNNMAAWDIVWKLRENY